MTRKDKNGGQRVWYLYTFLRRALGRSRLVRAHVHEFAHFRHTRATVHM
jgi:hypothetical protein